MGNTPKRIIIVEDEVFIADLYARQLTKAGYLVKTVNDGTTGLQELNQNEYDLLLLDIMLPGLNGLEILRQFKLTHPQSKMIIFLLTNLGQDTVIKEAFQLGANGYLIKAAYTPDQILVEVKKALDAAPQPPPAQ
jgi:DNA-binding response OmpR family regulator